MDQSKCLSPPEIVGSVLDDTCENARTQGFCACGSQPCMGTRLSTLYRKWWPPVLSGYSGFFPQGMLTGVGTCDY
jgi:hypothetical protein